MNNSQNKDLSFLPLKVVIDTNVFISGLFFGGIPEKILELIDKEVIQSCFSPKTFGELRSFLLHPKFQERREKLPFSVNNFLKNLFSKSILVYPQKVSQIIKEDPFDNYFLACAILSQASFIVSGDKHLRKLKEFQGILIVSPKEFLKIIKK